MKALQQTKTAWPLRPKRLKLTPPDPSEDDLQAAIAGMLRFAFNGQPVAWTHFPAGGYLLSPAAKARLSRLGLQPGYPDLLIQWPIAQTLWIELKTPNGIVRDTQRLRHQQLCTIGFAVHVCRRVDEVLDTLRLHQVPMNKVMI